MILGRALISGMESSLVKVRNVLFEEQYLRLVIGYKYI